MSTNKPRPNCTQEVPPSPFDPSDVAKGSVQRNPRLQLHFMGRSPQSLSSIGGRSNCQMCFCKTGPQQLYPAQPRPDPAWRYQVRYMFNLTFLCPCPAKCLLIAEPTRIPYSSVRAVRYVVRVRYDHLGAYSLSRLPIDSGKMRRRVTSTVWVVGKKTPASSRMTASGRRNFRLLCRTPSWWCCRLQVSRLSISTTVAMFLLFHTAQLPIWSSCGTS